MGENLYEKYRKRLEEDQVEYREYFDKHYPNCMTFNTWYDSRYHKLKRLQKIEKTSQKK
jgi:hypothetical protein